MSLNWDCPTCAKIRDGAKINGLCATVSVGKLWCDKCGKVVWRRNMPDEQMRSCMRCAHTLCVECSPDKDPADDCAKCHSYGLPSS
jgi:hypothetical protein